MYIGVAIVWLWVVDKVQPAWTDWLGVTLCLAGIAVIMAGPWLKR